MSTTPPEPGPWGDPRAWSDPPPGAGHAPPESRPEAPSTIRNAVVLMYVGAALALIGILVGLTQREEIRDQIRENDETLTETELDAPDNVVTHDADGEELGMVFTAIVGLVGVGLWIWMAVMNGRGKGWARIVATVLGGLGIFFTAIGRASSGAMGQPDSAFNTVLSLVTLALAAVILILLYQRPSSDYYEAVSRWEATAGPS